MNYAKEIGKGVLIGVANIVPGVSGGTLAISMGIYDKIIRSVTHIFKEPRKSIEALLPYGIGAGMGVVGLSFFIEFLFESFPLPTGMAFIGLIIGGIPALANKVRWRKDSLKEYVVLVVVFCLIIVTTVAGGSETRSVILEGRLLDGLSLFFVGIIAAATMVVPGVSGTMLLMMIGYYQPILSAINQFIVSVVTLEFGEAIKQCTILIPFGIGIGAGAFLFAKLVEFLMAEHESMTYSAIMGLVLSSPVVIIWGLPVSESGVLQIVTGFVCLVSAGILIGRLERV